MNSQLILASKWGWADGIQEAGINYLMRPEGLAGLTSDCCGEALPV
jgi:hypothetical protein